LKTIIFLWKKHPKIFESNFSFLTKVFPTDDEAYGLTCYLFSSKPNGRPRSNVFIKQDFRS